MTLAPDDAAEMIARLERIQTLIDTLAKARGDLAEQQELAERIQREIGLIKVTLQPSSFAS